MSRTPRSVVRLLLALVTAGAAAPGLHAQTGRLEPAEKPRLVSCSPSITQPAFRVRFNLVGADGAPLPIDVGSEKLVERVKIFVNEKEAETFFASAHGSQQQARRERIALVLVDISGSMNRSLGAAGSRFDAAKAALAEFVQSFEEKADQVAIVPFESHDVLRQIQGATFATTKAQALAQIGSLPVPKPRNNTAIYSSVVAGADLLAARVKSASSGGPAPEALLVLMTDGKNEIFAGDDPGLLDGPAGLTQAADAVKRSGVQAIAIGFGESGSVDEAALSRIATKSFMATDSEKLKQVFTIAHALLTDRITMTFASPWEDRASLAAETPKIRATVRTPAGQEFASSVDTWTPPQMGVPSFEDTCDPEELRAALNDPHLHTTTSSVWSWVRPLAVFAGLGALLMILWFWVPRLVWPEQYIGSLPTASRGKWAEMTMSGPPREGPRGRQAPAGFQGGGGKGGAQAPRAAGDRTVVSPEVDFSRSRLQRPGDRGRS